MKYDDCDCEKLKSCTIGCKDCPYYISKDFDYGICDNKKSINYKDEVYDTSCCDYVCNNKKGHKT